MTNLILNKYFIKKSAFIASTLALILLSNSAFAAENLGNKLAGRILLQVESKGEAWYVNPRDLSRHYMPNGDEAYKIMRNLGVGISNKDLEKIKNNKYLAMKQSGKIFLQVESRGEAYYVDLKGNLHYLQNGSKAYEAMRNMGLGIRSADLAKISIYQPKEVIQPVVSPKASSEVVKTNQPKEIIFKTPFKDESLIDQDSGLLCNGKKWSKCSLDQDFICPTNGVDAYCKNKKQDIITSNPIVAGPIINCSESWQCSTWGDCINGWQQRVCNDLNSCSSDSNKPQVLQKCVNNQKDQPVKLSCSSVSYDSSYINSVILAVQNNQVDVIKAMVENYPCGHLQELLDLTLRHSAWRGKMDIIQYILGQNLSDVDAKTQQFSPLYEAAAEGRLDIVQLLLDKGANPNLQGYGGGSPLSISLGDSFNTDIFKLLLDKGANVNLADNCGQTPLHRAAQNSKNDAMALLIKSGANINAKQCSFGDDYTPLMNAVDANNLSGVELLVKSGANINALSASGKTALTIASDKGYTSIASYLSQVSD